MRAAKRNNKYGSVYASCTGLVELLLPYGALPTMAFLPQVHPFLGFTNVLELQAQFLSSARSLSMMVLRGGGNWTCPLVSRSPNGAWVLVAPEDAVANLVRLRLFASTFLLCPLMLPIQ